MMFSTRRLRTRMDSVACLPTFEDLPGTSCRYCATTIIWTRAKRR